MKTLNKLVKVVIISTMITISSVTKVYAEEVNQIEDTGEPEKNYKGIGITAGFLSGLGFSYRQYFADRYGVKATGMGFFDQYQTFGNLGIQAMYVFSENSWLRFYGLLGVSNFTTRRNNYTNYDAPNSNDPNYVYIPSRGTYNYEAYNSLGAGIGIELGRLSQGLSFAIELPLVATFRNTTLNSFYPVPSLSVIYNF